MTWGDILFVASIVAASLALVARLHQLETRDRRRRDVESGGRGPPFG